MDNVYAFSYPIADLSQNQHKLQKRYQIEIREVYDSWEKLIW